MKKFLIIAFAIALCAIIFPHLFVRAQNQDLSSPDPVARQEQDLAKLFRKHDRLRINTAEIADQVRRTKELSIYTASVAFDLKLELHDMRAPNYRAVEAGADGVEHPVEMGPVRTYKGKVLGRDDAQARFTIDDQTLEGLIITPEERYMVEPMRKYSAAAEETDFVLYRSSDVIEGTPMTCEVTMDEEINQTMEGVTPQISEAPEPDTVVAGVREVQIATEADGEYVAAHGGTAASANNEILSIMNQVDGVYETELNMTFKVVKQSAWTSASSDPYPTTTDRVAVLNQFTNYWNTNFPPSGPFTASNPQRDVAHMWTGKNVGGGVAWSSFNGVNGVVCRDPSHSYGISPGIPSAPQKYILPAHEIGHNFSATHIETGDCVNTIMNASAGPNTALSFCTYSRNQITSYVNAYGSCLATVTTGCTFTISPTSKSFTSTGGSDRVSVTAGAGCQWTAKSNVSWITITAGSSGTGSGASSYTVAANTGTASRTGTITIAGKTFTVTEAAAARPSAFTISGRVTIGTSTTGLSGVTVKLTGTRALTATTNSLGNYSFTGLPTGNYRVTPTKLGYLFTPPNRAFTSLSANQTANFSAAARNFTITAKATLNGLGLSGVTMKLTGSRTLTCTTGTSGSCQFANLPAGGSYTVTPSKTGFTFTPPKRVYSYLTANQTASFTATPATGSPSSGP